MKHCHDNERGSVLLYAMLTMSAMLAIGLTLNSLFISKFRAASQQRNSVVALYAADSATEMCLYQARTGTAVLVPPFTMANGATVKIDSLGGQGDVTADCSVLGAATFSFRATGTFNGVRRTLEISQ